ncbi:MAG: FxDxF family PEP-CTERM protein [Pseudomonadota bacterium]
MNLIIKRLIVGLPLLLSMGVVNANVVNIGDLNTYGNVGYGTVVTHGTGAFSDVYNFSLSSASDLYSDASNMVLSLPGSSWNIQGLAMTLKNASNAVLASGLNMGPLYENPGLYSLTVTGTGTGSAGGKYAFDAIAVHAVPEPGIWAIMLSGLAMIGVMSRRRHKYRTLNKPA